MNARINPYTAPGFGDAYDYAHDEDNAELAAQRHDLDELAGSSYWLRKWSQDDTSDEAIDARDKLACLLIANGTPRMDKSERDDGLSDRFDALRDRLRACFDKWATDGQPSHLDRYRAAEAQARADSLAEDMEDEA